MYQIVLCLCKTLKKEKRSTSLFKGLLTTFSKLFSTISLLLLLNIPVFIYL